jgi:hypothetical protein
MSRFNYAEEYFKIHFTQIEKEIEIFPHSREHALALEKLEECYMWIGKMIRSEQIRLNKKQPPPDQL